MKEDLAGTMKSAMIDEFSYINVQDVVTNRTARNEVFYEFSDRA